MLKATESFVTKRNALCALEPWHSVSSWHKTSTCHCTKFEFSPARFFHALLGTDRRTNERTDDGIVGLASATWLQPCSYRGLVATNHETSCSDSRTSDIGHDELSYIPQRIHYTCMRNEVYCIYDLMCLEGRWAESVAALFRRYSGWRTFDICDECDRVLDDWARRPTCDADCLATLLNTLGGLAVPQRTTSPSCLLQLTQWYNVTFVTECIA